MKLALPLLLTLIIFTADPAAAGSQRAAPTDKDFYSPNVYGVIGLNKIPTARMDAPDTARLSLGTANPYTHLQAGVQFGEIFYFGLRQSGQASNPLDDPERLFPGVDARLRIAAEGRVRPQAVLGVQSAFGNRRFAGEYLALSKRYYDFDLTTGLGWGRSGGKDFALSTNLPGKRGDAASEKPSSPSDWLRGNAGLFAGVEYFTPWDGISLKADYSGDDFDIEKDAGLRRQKPYALGINWKMADAADLSIAAIGDDTVMARFSLYGSLEGWPFRASEKEASIPPRITFSQKIAREMSRYGDALSRAISKADIFSASIDLMPDPTTPRQLGQGWRLMSRTAEPKISTLRIEPVFFGLTGTPVSVSRRDVENEFRNNGSPEEIWRHKGFDNNISAHRNTEHFFPLVALRENISLSEEDEAAIHRTDILATYSQQFFTRFLTEGSLRYNLASNLDRLRKTRPFSDDPVRSDIDNYYRQRLAVERAFLQSFKSFSPSLHASLSAGYLEGLFSGYRGELLYRPFGKNWATGIEAAQVNKRDYRQKLNLGSMDDTRFTGHVNLYYEIPDTDMTLKASAGRYLGQDDGATFALSNRFENGARLEAYITATNGHDPDPYSSETNMVSGIRLRLPLGSIPMIPNGSSADINLEPEARDKGQRLDTAHPLYDMTENLSYRHILRNWKDVGH